MCGAHHFVFFFFFNDTATTEIYTLSHTTLFRSAGRHRLRPACRRAEREQPFRPARPRAGPEDRKSTRLNSSHVEISYAVFCLKKKKKKTYALKNTQKQKNKT